jgi:hypothetical protein
MVRDLIKIVITELALELGLNNKLLRGSRYES